MKRPPSNQLSFPVMADLMPRADGTFVLRPRPMIEADCDTWISVREASQHIGICTKSVYPMLGVYLSYRRPLPMKIQVSLKSVVAYKAAIADPEFWMNAELKQRLRKGVEMAMQTGRNGTHGKQ